MTLVMGRRVFGTLVASTLVVSVAAADASQPVDSPWSAAFPGIEAAIAVGEPLAIQVLVPLCSNEQVRCGSRWAGQPASLRANLYWGAAFGARRFFDDERNGWEKVTHETGERPWLARAVYRRWVPGDAWGRQARVEQLAVLDAVHGSDIDQAVSTLYERAANGAQVKFTHAGRERTVRILAIGYSGHNRLMDGVAPVPAREASSRALPAFVLACQSEKYFGSSLRQASAGTLLMTRTNMAPEGYVLHGLLEALGDNLSLARVRRRVVHAYARWQRIDPGAADWTFAPVRID